MNKKEFINLCAASIANNPDWLEDATWALSKGIAERLKLEQKQRADAETSVALLAGNLGKVPEHQKEIVVRTIQNSGLFGGTEFARKLGDPK